MWLFENYKVMIVVVAIGIGLSILRTIVLTWDNRSTHDKMRDDL